MPAGQPQFPTLEEKVDADNRSIYVGQVKKIFFSQKAELPIRFLSEIQMLSNIHHSLLATGTATDSNTEYNDRPKIRPKIDDVSMFRWSIFGRIFGRTLYLWICILGILSFENLHTFY